MGASSGVLRARQAVRIPVWLVIGVSLALVGLLAVATMTERYAVTRASTGGAITEEIVAPAQSAAAEMAELKSGVAQRYLARGQETETGTGDWAPNVAPSNRGPVKWGGPASEFSDGPRFGRHS